MHVHAQAALGSELAQQPDAQRAVRHGSLEMRNAADHIHALVERTLQVVHVLLGPLCAAQHTVLREGHQLQIDVGRNAALHFEQGIYRQQTRIADVNMAANRQQPFGHRPVAVGQRALDQRLLRQQRLQLTPQRNAFEQRARLIHARQAVTQRGVHMEVGVDKRRAEQLALGIDELVRVGRQGRADFDNEAILHGHRHVFPTIGERGVLNQ